MDGAGGRGGDCRGAAGFVITGFYEDYFPEEDEDPLDKYMASFIAMRAVKE